MFFLIAKFAAKRYAVRELIGSDLWRERRRKTRCRTLLWSKLISGCFCGLKRRAGTRLWPVSQLQCWCWLPRASCSTSTAACTSCAAIGCRYMQGYYYGKPMPQSEFEALLRAESAKKAREIHESGINSKIFLNTFYKISTKISTRTVQLHVFLTEPTKFAGLC